MRRGGATATGAVREFGEALARRSFRVALAFSLLAHAGFLLGLRGINPLPPVRPSLRLHFVREVPPPVAPPVVANRLPRPVRDAEAGRVTAARGGAEAPIPAAAKEAAAGAPPAASPATPSPTAAPPVHVAAAPQAEQPVPPTAGAPPAPAEATVSPDVAEPAAVPEIPGARRAADAGSHASAPALGSPAAGAGPDAVPAWGAVAGGGVPPAGAPPSADAGPGAAVGSGGATGGETGHPGGAGAPSGAVAAAGGVDASGPSAQQIAALRRRIDARKVYPQIAIRNGWEGRVLVEMHLDLEGRLAGVRLVAGSGYSILDEATITAVRLASPFPPIARVVTVPVEYRLIP